MLAIESLEVRYGKVPAVQELSLEVSAGEIVCFVGQNGAGKSTTMHAIAGIVPIAKGDIRFEGQSIRNLSPEAIVRKGIALAPEGRRIFTRLTVRENLVVASGLHGGLGRQRAKFEAILDLFPVLRARLDGAAGQLSGGEQQQLAIARAMLCQPRLLLVDEPSLGLAPMFVTLVFDALRRLRDEGATLLVVEQSARRALAFADRIYLIRSGRLILQGKSADLAADPEFERAYFGEAQAA